MKEIQLDPAAIMLQLAQGRRSRVLMSRGPDALGFFWMLSQLQHPLDDPTGLTVSSASAAPSPIPSCFPVLLPWLWNGICGESQSRIC